MLTAKEAAALLGISAREVYRLVGAGKLACYRFGTAVRFEKADLTPSMPKPLLSARILRETERLRMTIPETERPPSSLTQDQLAIATKRSRRQRMPPWGDGKAIRAMQAEARRLTRETGVPHHVDHIIPLQGEFVSGLHVHTNMQILTGTENIKKRNRYEV